MEALHVLGWLCSRGCDLCLSPSWLECCWATQLPGLVPSPSGQLGLEVLLSTVAGTVTQHLAWEWANWPQGRQNSLSEDPNEADLHPTEFPGQRHPQIGSADEQSHWLGWLLGHCRCELWSAKISVLVIAAPPAFSIIVTFHMVRSCRFSCRARGGRPEGWLLKSDLQCWRD